MHRAEYEEAKNRIERYEHIERQIIGIERSIMMLEDTNCTDLKFSCWNSDDTVSFTSQPASNYKTNAVGKEIVDAAKRDVVKLLNNHLQILRDDLKNI